jgi:hypothetical protein
MKVILKMFGMPRTGTNLLHLLMTLNFKNYVCGKAEHDEDFLGWKHGVPRDMGHYLELEKLSNESVRFVFTSREFESWKKSYTTKHFASWENPSRFAIRKDRVVFCTPVGMEIYRDLRDLYDTKTDIYHSFCQLNPDRAMIVPFELMTRDQEETVRFIQDKFDLERTQEHIVTIPKHIGSDGVLVDMQ